MKTLATITLFLFTALSFAQTDIIEMRSRNASLKKYECNVRSNRLDNVTTNFGAAPMPEVRTAVLDSVKCLSDTVAIMYTSNYCSRGLRPRLDFAVGYFEQGQKVTRTYSNPRVGHLWQPGVDTIINHPLFRHRHSLDSVKYVIDNDYHFNLPSDSVRFIGFDNANAKVDLDLIEKEGRREENQNSSGWEILLLILTPVLFSSAVIKYTIPSLK